MHSVFTLLNTAGRSTITNKLRPRITINVSPDQKSMALIQELPEETPLNLFASYTIQTITIILPYQKKRDIRTYFLISNFLFYMIAWYWQIVYHDGVEKCDVRLTLVSLFGSQQIFFTEKAFAFSNDERKVWSTV